MTHHHTAHRVADQLEPARERLSVVSDRAREGADLARDRAREGMGVARERAAEVAETVEPQARRASAAIAGATRGTLASLTVVPGILSKALALLATSTGALAERGREAAARVEPPAAHKRRSKLRTAAWFLGGFGAGAATGWLVHARMYEPPHQADIGYPDAGEGSPYGPEADVIDARRGDASLG